METIKDSKCKFEIVGVYNSDDYCYGHNWFKPNQDIKIVFKGKKNYLYFGYANNQTKGPFKYTEFKAIDTDKLKKVKFLSDIEYSLEGTKSFYSVGDYIIYGYEYEKNKVFIGSIDKYADFYLDHPMDEEYYDNAEVNKNLKREKRLYLKHIKEDK